VQSITATLFSPPQPFSLSKKIDLTRHCIVFLALIGTAAFKFPPSIRSPLAWPSPAFQASTSFSPRPRVPIRDRGPRE
jgi:hypothetical protein